MPPIETFEAPQQPAVDRQVSAGTSKVFSFAKTPDSGDTGTDAEAGKIAVFVLADIRSEHRLWGYARFILQSLPLRKVKGLVFSKIMGSGYDGGFGIRPSSSRQALFCLFTDEDSAQAFLESELICQYEIRSREFCTAKLRAYSSKGSWSGSQIAITASTPESGPIATLTRASIRPTRARAFWRMQPASEISLSKAQGCIFATGVGEAPLLRQATFSLWRNVQAMDDYARSGAHQEAIRAAYAGNFFSESMFVRFVPLCLRGDWRGRHYD
jgi:spheroidene monooxygenase